MIEKILSKLWKQNEPDTVIDSSFVNKVIIPAMIKYTELSTMRTTRIIKEQSGFESMIDVVECCKNCSKCGKKILRD